MTLIYEYDLDILKMYLQIPKAKFTGQSFQKLEPRKTHRHTDMTECITMPHSRVVKM